MPRSTVREELYELARSWEEKTRLDRRNRISFRGLLDEIFFRADLCFEDYVQYRREGVFPVRLKKWLNNINDDRSKKALFELLDLIIFIDRMQMEALYRDAYRRIITPFIIEGVFSVSDIISNDFERRVINLLRRYQLCSITDSFNNPDFLHTNDLTGLLRPIILSQIRGGAGLRWNKRLFGLIIFEDFVGTGTQAIDILSRLNSIVPEKWRLLFVPLIILEQGFNTLSNEPRLSRFIIKPGLIIDNTYCIREYPSIREPDKFKYIRAVIKATASRVLEPMGEYDDPPDNPFGYKGSGALVVTCHNTPNNTLPLIHHRAPSWSPLFRRIHHSEDGL